MSLRDKIQSGYGRSAATVALPLVLGVVAYYFWPKDSSQADRILSGLQKIAFVTATFAVTAYNLRTRVVDFVLKLDGKPARVSEFCRIARACGRRLTNLVVFFTATSGWLGALTVLEEASRWGRIAGAVSLSLFAASLVSFVYVVFAFERLERLALDEAEEKARVGEGNRLFGEKPDGDQS